MKKVFCPTCHHAPHQPGQCEQCNCGESEIVVPTGRTSYVWGGTGRSEMTVISSREMSRKRMRLSRKRRQDNEK